MITYNGIDLDYYDSSLKGLVIKGGLTKIDSLSARTTISSTEFELPRTAKNELAFGNITTEGSQGSAFGSAYIKLDGNIFVTGTLYVKGYNENNFQCIFFGADGDVIKLLIKKQLYDLFDKDQQLLYTDSHIKIGLENVSVATLGTGISYHFGHPFLFQLEAAGNLKKNNVAPFFSVRHILHKMFKDLGVNLNSNFLDSAYGQSLDYSCYVEGNVSENTTRVSNIFKGTANQVPLSAPSGYSSAFVVGTPLGGNNSIVPTIDNTLRFTRDVSNVRIRADIDYVQGELDTCQFSISVIDPYSTNIVVYTSIDLTGQDGLLREGRNPLSLDLPMDLPENSYIFFKALYKTQNSYPLSGSSLIMTNINISHDGATGADSINFGDYITKRSQFDFLKGMLTQFNLVLDIVGSEAYIELQDEGFQPVGTPTILVGIASDSFDLTNIVESRRDVSIDYIQADSIYLNSKVTSTVFVDSLNLFPFSAYGSYLFNLNSFGNQEVEVYEMYFNTMQDSDSFTIYDNHGASESFNSWDNYISSRYKFDDNYDGTINLDYINEDDSTTNLDCLVNWSEPTMASTSWRGLFANTLEQKKNNKIIEVTFLDELGTIVNNRREYILDNQVYKIVSWDYDLQTKLVKANLIMK